MPPAAGRAASRSRVFSAASLGGLTRAKKTLRDEARFDQFAIVCDIRCNGSRILIAYLHWHDVVADFLIRQSQNNNSGEGNMKRMRFRLLGFWALVVGMLLAAASFSWAQGQSNPFLVKATACFGTSAKPDRAHSSVVRAAEFASR
jgi:hypothetical protein